MSVTSITVTVSPRIIRRIREEILSLCAKWLEEEARDDSMNKLYPPRNDPWRPDYFTRSSVKYNKLIRQEAHRESANKLCQIAKLLLSGHSVTLGEEYFHLLK